MNLAEEFTRLHEAWNAASVTDAPRARHAFAVFCHENAEAISAGLRAFKPEPYRNRTLEEFGMRELKNSVLTAIGEDLDTIGKYLGEEFSRRYMNDGRKPDFTTGIPLESDAEYRERILNAHEHKSPVSQSTTSAPFDVEAERIAFEEWAKERHSVQEWGLSPLSRSDEGQGYRNTVIQSAWIGWCAHAKGKTP